MDAINLLAATATIVSPTSASDQFVGHLGNACTSEELFDETLSSGMCAAHFLLRDLFKIFSERGLPRTASRMIRGLHTTQKGRRI
ncbi:hypothetical protein KCU90_g4, partial [Aureobasidium melanogenum]